MERNGERHITQRPKLPTGAHFQAQITLPLLPDGALLTSPLYGSMYARMYVYAHSYV